MSSLYLSVQEQMLSGSFDILEKPISFLLVDDAYAFDTGHENLDDALNVMTMSTAGSGVIAEGELVNARIEQGRLVADANLVQPFTSGTVSGVLLLFLEDNDIDSKLIAYINQGGFPLEVTGSDISISWGSYIISMGG